MILKRFLGRAQHALQSAKPAVPEGRRIYAVGDIHGRLDLLNRLQALIFADAAASSAPEKILVYLGDYIDRGPQSREVVDHLIDHRPASFEHIFLLGNHEDMMARFLEDITIAPTWLSNGGAESLSSYGVSVPSSDAAAVLTATQEQLWDRLPARHREFLRTLRLSHQEGDYMFVHAGIRPGRALNAQVQQDLIWMREPFLSSRLDHGKIIVHGHTITPEVDETPNRIGIDTGAFQSGKLSCLVLEATHRTYLAT